MSAEQSRSGFSVEDVVELEGAHAAGDVREGHREGAAEAAALVGLAEGDDFEVADPRRGCGSRRPGVGVPRVWQEWWKAMRVGFSSEPFHSVTPRPLTMKSSSSQVRSASEVIGSGRAPPRTGAGCRGSSSRRRSREGTITGQVAGEDLGGVPGDLARGFPVARVEGRLAAAGLVLGEDRPRRRGARGPRRWPVRPGRRRRRTGRCP